MKLNITKVAYGFVVMALYLMIGTFALMKYVFWTGESNIGMAVFGVVVILYGLFRGYRSYKASQVPTDEQDEVE